MKTELLKSMSYYAVIAVALWKLNILKWQMILLELMHRH
jgi:hypothetical protein